jgi:hypothetical protein
VNQNNPGPFENRLWQNSLIDIRQFARDAISKSFPKMLFIT